MKKLVVVFVVGLIIMLTGMAYGEDLLQLDFSQSSIQVINPQTIRIRHISNAVLQGTPVSGEWWVEFVWDPNKLIFVPDGQFGQEVVPTGTPCTTSFTNINSNDVFSLTLTPDPASGLIYVSAKATVGSPFMDPGQGTISQGSNSFEIMDYFTGDDGWDGATIEYTGVVKSGYISVPSWYDFSSAYTYDNILDTPTSVTCNP